MRQGRRWLSRSRSFPFQVLLLLVGIGPSLLSEIFPSRVPHDGTRSGRWLDSGFRVARWAGRLHVATLLVVLPAGFLVERVARQSVGWTSVMRTNAWVLITLGTALGLVGSGLLMFRARLKAFTLGLRGALEIFLQIDTYLREYPRECDAPRPDLHEDGFAIALRVCPGVTTPSS